MKRMTAIIEVPDGWSLERAGGARRPALADTIYAELKEHGRVAVHPGDATSAVLSALRRRARRDRRTLTTDAGREHPTVERLITVTLGPVSS